LSISQRRRSKTVNHLEEEYDFQSVRGGGVRLSISQRRRSKIVNQSEKEE